MKIFKICLCMMYSSLLFGFTPGSGSEYELTMKNSPKAKLSIYITKSKNNFLGVEFYMESNSLIRNQLWQQFILKKGDHSVQSIEKGFIQTAQMKHPQIMSDKFLKQNNGVQITDFIFQNKKQLEKFKIGIELVETPAGDIIAHHYRKKRNSQIIDFWISPKALPIGLVKLQSRGKKSSHNYDIKLNTLLRNVKAKISASDAIPLNQKGKKLLSSIVKN